MKNPSRIHKIGIVSLGCAKNLVDTEVLMRQLDANHFKVILDPSDIKSIDTAIINTCGFIADAKQESIDTILQFTHAKASGQLRKVFVMGCLSQRYASSLAAEIPEVDGFFGINDLKKIISELGGNFKTELIGERKISTPSHYAYLKIAEGCDRKCSFCAIPLIRGKHISRSVDEIITEAKKIAKTGVRELILISQDTTYYGIDSTGKRQIAGLLHNLSKISGLEWIRLHYTYPHGFPMELLDVIRDTPNICNYIDIPLQHAGNRILKSMQRNMTLDKSRDLLLKIRSKIPDVALRTTFIVGYPGETEKEFSELEQFVREIQFERMGVFTYSHEEGTSAYQLQDNIPEKVKQERVSVLMNLQEEISSRLNHGKIGRTMKVVIDSDENDYYVGRSEYDSPEIDNEIILNKSDNTLQIGSFYNVKIIKAGNFELYAELV